VNATEIDDDEELRSLMRGSMPIRFDWEHKWLRGDQYAHMLYNLDHYVNVFNMQKMMEKEHPENIYIEPKRKFPSTFFNNYFRWPGVLR